jgi:hypothetical protein
MARILGNKMNKEIFQAIANNLIDFGYSGITSKMIEEIYIAKKAKKKLPHGIIGMFADGQLDEAIKKGLLK